MPIILNLNTKEYFVSSGDNEQRVYLKKLLTYKPPTEKIDWKVVYPRVAFKSVIRWNKTDRIVIVMPTTEGYILNSTKYQRIELNKNGVVSFANII